MPSKTDICNLALGKISQGFITNIDDEVRPAEVCKMAFPVLLRGMLHDHKWNFAESRKVLAQDVAAPVSEFAYQYTLPADCVRVWKLNGSERIKWKVEKGKLLTDESTATIEFTSYVDDPNQWGGKFTEAMYLLLASYIAGPLSSNEKRGKEVLGEHLLVLDVAKAVDGQEQSQDQMECTALTDDIRDI